MAKILIKKNVPVKTMAGRPFKYPFADMKLGESFTIESEDYGALTAANAWAKRKKNKVKFKGSLSEGMLTIWRIK